MNEIIQIEQVERFWSRVADVSAKLEVSQELRDKPPEVKEGVACLAVMLGS